MDSVCNSYIVIHALGLFFLRLKDMYKRVVCFRSQIPSATQVSCSPHLDQHMPERALSQRITVMEKKFNRNSKQNNANHGTSYFLSSHQNKNKLPNKTAKSNYQVIKKHTINSIISKTWERNMNIPKILKQEENIQPSCLMKLSFEIILIHCYYQKLCCCRN